MQLPLKRLESETDEHLADALSKMTNSAALRNDESRPKWIKATKLNYYGYTLFLCTGKKQTNKSKIYRAISIFPWYKIVQLYLLRINQHIYTSI